MEYAWLTDTHLNFLPDQLFSQFIINLKKKKVQGLLITGDISNGRSCRRQLKILAQSWDIPIYFILGNHDFYGSTFAKVKEKINKLQSKIPNLIYLTDKPPLLLNKTALIGDDGWYDARNGKALLDIVFLPDWIRIKDFHFLTKEEKMVLIRDLALQAAQRVKKKLESALLMADKVYFMTHVPPWPEGVWYDPIRQFWMPYNSSKIMAQMLEDIMYEFPNKKLIVLSGHTHIRRDELIKPNIRLKVGHAQAYLPKIEEIIEF